MDIEIKKSLSVLELGDLARIIEMQEKDIKLVDLSYEKRLELLLETLIQERENRLINRLIKNAYFKYPSASIESLDYDARQIKKSTILNLATMGFGFQTDKKVHDPESGHNGICFQCNKSCHHRTDRCGKDLPCMCPWRGSMQTDLQGFVYQDA